MRIGYIGLGNMGGPMAANLVKAGCDVLIYDLEKTKVDQYVACGATAGVSGEDVAARVDILFTSLPEPRHVEAAIPSLLDVMQPGSIWVDLTTNSRDLVKSLAAQAAKKNILALEAPVTGAVDGARLGKLTFFVGGDTDVIERVRPYFEIMGKLIICGPIGTGNVVKLITNQIWFINAAAIGEGLVLGKKAGIDLAVVWEAMKNSVGDTFVARHDAPSIFSGDYDPSFSLALCCKDLRLLKELGEELETQMDMTLLARDKFEEAKETFGGDAAELHVCKLVEDASNTDLRLDGDWTKHWEV